MSAAPPLSVLLSVRNGMPYVPETIESIRRQSFADFEFVIVDNVSTDGTRDLLHDVARDDSRIRVFLNEQDLGHSGGLNRGLSECRASWVARIDADDVALPERLARQLVFLEENAQLGVSSCLAYYIDPKGKRVGKTFHDLKTPADFARYFAAGEMIGILHPGALMDRALVERLGGYREAFGASNDIDLWARVAETGRLILVQQEYLMEYRVHPAQGTSKVHGEPDALRMGEGLRAGAPGRKSGAVLGGFSDRMEERPLPAPLESRAQDTGEVSLSAGGPRLCVRPSAARRDWPRCRLAASAFLHLEAALGTGARPFVHVSAERILSPAEQTLLKEYLAALTAEGITWMVLRNFQDFPERIGHDLDLFVPRSELDRATAVFHRLLGTAGGRIFITHERDYFRDIRFTISHDAGQALTLDLYHGAYTWHGLPYLSDAELIAGVRMSGELRVPRKAHEALGLVLASLLWGGFFKSRYQARIAELLAASGEREEFNRCLYRAFGAAAALSFDPAVEAGREPEHVKSDAARLRRDLRVTQFRRAPLSTLAWWLIGGANCVRAFARAGSSLRCWGPMAPGNRPSLQASSGGSAAYSARCIGIIGGRESCRRSVCFSGAVTFRSGQLRRLTGSHRIPRRSRFCAWHTTLRIIGWDTCLACCSAKRRCTSCFSTAMRPMCGATRVAIVSTCRKVSCVSFAPSYLRRILLLFC